MNWFQVSESGVTLVVSAELLGMKLEGLQSIFLKKNLIDSLD